MLVLSDDDLKKRLAEEDFSIHPSPMERAFNANSINLRLDSTLLKYLPQTIRLGSAEIETREIDLDAEGEYVLAPGEFILGTTLEEVVLSERFAGYIETKGNIARAGIQISNCDGHIDPGFRGHITLEIKNMQKDVSIRLIPGIYICQFFVYPLSSPSKHPYRGKYYGQDKPTPYRPD